MGERVRNYVFTYNNYDDIGVSELKEWLTDNAKYAIFGYEIAPTTGTPHLQGYMNLKKAMTISAIQNKCHVGWSIRAAKADELKNREYCSKDGDYWEHGRIDRIGQGKRNELKRFTDRLDTEPLKRIALDPEFRPTFVKYHNGLKALERLMKCPDPPEDRDISVSVFWGPGGTGKTRAAVSYARKLGLDYYFAVNPNGSNQWWDFYFCQRLLIIDDFYGWIAPHVLFRILDRYSLMLPWKGDHVFAHWTHVIVTSNLPPEKFYREEVFQKIDATAYFRRFHNIYHYDHDGLITKLKEEKPFTCIEQ